ncbi:MAG: serine/threonine protein kinase [Pirellulales bacterium]|nr:serine/threonine protein kinase [Pirellulales bacterium]
MKSPFHSDDDSGPQAAPGRTFTARVASNAAGSGSSSTSLSASTEATRGTLSDRLSERSITFGLSEQTTERDDLLLGVDLGGVAIERLIAEGGMGRVYLGRQQRPARAVAVKFMRHGRSTTALERFRKEAEVLGRLTHPGIARVFSAGSLQIGLDEVPFSVMEYIPDAEPLVGFSDAHGCCIDARLRLFLQTCEAVAYGHAQGVVHRDLKPGNILVTREGAGPEGRVCVIDFGIAKLIAEDDDESVTSTGEFLGTRRYMSPEQLSGVRTRLDARTDVYTLGVILHELLTGRLPYDTSGRTIEETARIVSQARPRPLTLSDTSAAPLLRQGLRRIAERCLQKSPADRYATAAELADELRSLLAGVAVPRRSSQRLNRWLAALAALAAILIAAFTAAIPLGLDRSLPESTRLAQATGVPLTVKFTATKAKRSTPMEWILLPFTSPVDDLRLSFFSLTRDGEPVDLAGCQLTRETDHAWRLSGLTPCNAREGVYVLSLDKKDAVRDRLGRPLTGKASATWTMPPYRAWRLTPLTDSWKEYLVSMEGLERYTEQDAGSDSFFRPTAVGEEGSMVFHFDAPFEIDAAELRAHIMVWTTGDPFPYDPGARASLDVSPDGENWTTIAVREAGNGGGLIAAIGITDIVRGGREVWVRARVEATVEWPGDGLIHAQFLRTNSLAPQPSFILQVAAAHADEQRSASEEVEHAAGEQTTNDDHP